MRILLVILLFVIGCGNGAVVDEIKSDSSSSQDDTIFRAVQITAINNESIEPPLELNPCNDRHDIDDLSDNITVDWGDNITVDWGSKRCRFIFLDGFNVLGKKEAIIIGFRSDGVVVWKHEEE